MKSKRKKLARSFDVSDVPINSIKRPIYNVNTDQSRPNVKLRTLMDREKYEEARTLFIEMVKSNKFNFGDLWQAGIEIIGKSAPQELTGYLKAIFISSPVNLSSETFNLYIDQLMIEEKWTEAFEEMESRYINPLYHHPILLRKMTISLYNLWKIARNKLPETYFEEEEHDRFDVNVVRYEKYLRSTTKLLAEAHQTYLRDVELFKMYIDFLTMMDDEDTISIIVLKSLDAFNNNPEYYLLFYLMKFNKDDKYFNNKDYVLRLYEFDPYLDGSELGLKRYCQTELALINKVNSDIDATGIEIEKCHKVAARIFRLYVYRVEHGNPEHWFLVVISRIFKMAICEELCDIYYYYNVDQLLRSSFVKGQLRKVDVMDKAADELKQIVAEYILDSVENDDFFQKAKIDAEEKVKMDVSDTEEAEVKLYEGSEHEHEDSSTSSVEEVEEETFFRDNDGMEEETFFRDNDGMEEETFFQDNDGIERETFFRDNDEIEKIDPWIDAELDSDSASDAMTSVKVEIHDDDDTEYEEEGDEQTYCI